MQSESVAPRDAIQLVCDRLDLLQQDQYVKAGDLAAELDLNAERVQTILLRLTEVGPLGRTEIVTCPRTWCRTDHPAGEVLHAIEQGDEYECSNCQKELARIDPPLSVVDDFFVP